MIHMAVIHMAVIHTVIHIVTQRFFKLIVSIAEIFGGIIFDSSKGRHTFHVFINTEQNVKFCQ